MKSDNELKAKIFNIQRFSTDDGPGIRTTVFFKGCPLDCVWCHNPESKSTGNKIFYAADKCIGCCACVKECPKGCHIFEDGIHFFDRSKCGECGRCTKVCYTEALLFCGREIEVRELVKEVLKDRDFFVQSGGGVTISGGEPLLQGEFALSFFKMLKKEGIDTCIETSGYVKTDIIQKIAEYTDTFYYDFKVGDPVLHKKYTGVSNELIMKNLSVLDNSGADIVLRLPMIPKINIEAEHFEKAVEIANKYKGIKEIHLLPYHPLGISKSERLGIRPVYDNGDFLDRNELIGWAEMLEKRTGKTIVIK